MFACYVPWKQKKIIRHWPLRHTFGLENPTLIGTLLENPTLYGTEIDQKDTHVILSGQVLINLGHL